VIVQRTSHQQQPQLVPGGLVGYPSYPAMGQQVYAPTTGAGYHPSSNASAMPPYPVHASNMPMPGGQQRFEHSFQQAGPPYPTTGAMPSAPLDMDDPPPSYLEAVSKQ